MANSARLAGLQRGLHGEPGGCAVQAAVRRAMRRDTCRAPPEVWPQRCQSTARTCRTLDVLNVLDELDEQMLVGANINRLPVRCCTPDAAPHVAGP